MHRCNLFTFAAVHESVALWCPSLCLFFACYFSGKIATLPVAKLNFLHPPDPR